MNCPVKLKNMFFCFLRFLIDFALFVEQLNYILYLMKSRVQNRFSALLMYLLYVVDFKLFTGLEIRNAIIKYSVGVYRTSHLYRSRFNFFTGSHSRKIFITREANTTSSCVDIPSCKMFVYCLECIPYS